MMPTRSAQSLARSACGGTARSCTEWAAVPSSSAVARSRLPAGRQARDNAELSDMRHVGPATAVAIPPRSHIRRPLCEIKNLLFF
ncbi:MAG: hypothetical protein HY569_02695 [Candidatus Magasanikbacteria bacterium]|nr:hypothetical protein [Candidatus Magasanikbacteria bacterium]